MRLGSRIVAREFKSGDKPDLYAGTLPPSALKAIMSIAASQVHVDVSRAYFHGKAQRPVLVKLLAEDCSGKDEGFNRTAEEKHVLYQRCSKQLGTRLAKASRKLGLSSRSLFRNKKKKTSGMTHRDALVVTGSKRSLLELKKQLESVERHRSRFGKEHQGAEPENMLERDKDIVSTRPPTR